MARAYKWINKDGLAVGSGRHTTDNDVPAKLSKTGEVHTILISVPDMSLLNDDVTDTSGTDVGLYQQAALLPANAKVVEVRIVTKTACTGTSSTLLLGNYTWDAVTRVYTAVDADGFCNATDGALAGFNVAGETLTLGKSANAALLGKAVAHTAVSAVFPTYGTAFDSGAVDIYLDYVISK